jgi:hypothetical protein
MDTQFINGLIYQSVLLILVPLIAYCFSKSIVYIRKAFEMLPSNVRKVVWGYTNTVVKAIMQKANKDWTDEQKKAYAVQKIQLFLHNARITTVSDEEIGHIIEQVIFEIKKTMPPDPPAVPQVRRASLL